MNHLFQRRLCKPNSLPWILRLISQAPSNLPVRHYFFDSFKRHIVAALFDHLFLCNLTQGLTFVDDAGAQLKRNGQSCWIFFQIDFLRCCIRWIGRNYWMINGFKYENKMKFNYNFQLTTELNRANLGGIVSRRLIYCGFCSIIWSKRCHALSIDPNFSLCHFERNTCEMVSHRVNLAAMLSIGFLWYFPLWC